MNGGGIFTILISVPNFLLIFLLRNVDPITSRRNSDSLCSRSIESKEEKIKRKRKKERNDSRIVNHFIVFIKKAGNNKREGNEQEKKRGE